MYATQYLERIWPLGSSLCYATAVFRYINAFGDWVSVGIIAVSRCVCLLKPGFCGRYLTKENSCIICLLIWAYAAMIMIPLFTGVRHLKSIPNYVCCKSRNIALEYFKAFYNY